MMGAVTPNALPIDVSAIAISRAEPRSERRDIGAASHALNNDLLSVLTFPA